MFHQFRSKKKEQKKTFPKRKLQRININAKSFRITVLASPGTDRSCFPYHLVPVLNESCCRPPEAALRAHNIARASLQLARRNARAVFRSPEAAHKRPVVKAPCARVVCKGVVLMRFCNYSNSTKYVYGPYRIGRDRFAARF